MNWTDFLAHLGGTAVIVGGLAAWLGKVWFERIANREREAREKAVATLRAELEGKNAEIKSRLDAELQRTMLVDKVQFEHEYEVYKRVWQTLFSLEKVTLKLRPKLDQFDPGESEDDRKNRRLKDFAEAFGEYQDVIEETKPFYAPDVYSALSKVRSLCYRERVSYECGDRFDREYWDKATQNEEAI